MSTVPCRGPGCARIVSNVAPHHMCDDCAKVMDWTTKPRGGEHHAPPAHDPVTRPAHYTAGKVESIDAIESALGRDGFIAYCIGNNLKYLNRLGKKDDALQDARKARWYLDRAIKTLEAA